jgi:hypothetical protein
MTTGRRASLLSLASAGGGHSPNFRTVRYRSKKAIVLISILWRGGASSGVVGSRKAL